MGEAETSLLESEVNSSAETELRSAETWVRKVGEMSGKVEERERGYMKF
jgi:hypothetical protein